MELRNSKQANAREWDVEIRSFLRLFCSQRIVTGLEDIPPFYLKGFVIFFISFSSVEYMKPFELAWDIYISPVALTYSC